MDITKLITTSYKQELADANEKKILFQVQCQVYKAQIEELEKIIKEKDEEIDRLKNE